MKKTLIFLLLLSGVCSAQTFDPLSLQKMPQQRLLGRTGPTTGNATFIKLGSDFLIRNDSLLYVGAGGSSAISSLTAATGTNDINNANYGQIWRWNSLGTGAGLTLASSSTASTDAGHGLLGIDLQGANANSSQTTYAASFANSHTGTSSTNIGLLLQASGGTNNYALDLGVAGSNTGRMRFNGSTSGSVVIQPASAAGTYTLTLPTDDGTSGQFLQTDGSGALTWATASGSGSPAGNFGNIQINRNGAFATPASDSLDFESATGLTVKGNITSSGGRLVAGTYPGGIDISTAGKIESLSGTLYVRDGTNVFLQSGGVTSGVFEGSKFGVGIGGASPTHTLQSGGSFATKYVSKSGNYTLTISEQCVEVTATGLTMTLPTAVGIDGRIYTIKLTASGSSTIATTSSQTIDGSTTYSLSAQYKYVTVMSNGSNWIVIGNN